MDFLLLVSLFLRWSAKHSRECWYFPVAQCAKHLRKMARRVPSLGNPLGGDPEINLMLGVKCDNRESVHGPMKVVLTPNIGLEMEMSDAISDFLLDNSNPLRRDLLEKSSEDEL